MRYATQVKISVTMLDGSSSAVGNWMGALLWLESKLQPHAAQKFAFPNNRQHLLHCPLFSTVPPSPPPIVLIRLHNTHCALAGIVERTRQDVGLWEIELP